jgi:hypothetical protein
VAGAASRGRRGRGRHRHRMRVHSPGGLTVSQWIRLVREVGFEHAPAPAPVRLPRSSAYMPCDLRFLHTGPDRSCPPSTSGFRCRADPARTRATSLEGASGHSAQSGYNADGPAQRACRPTATTARWGP